MQEHANWRERLIPVCCVAVIAALYVVGFVSRTELRHVVQTLPLWAGAILGYVGARVARWFALALFVFWLVLMSLIWLYLLGWANVIHGHFSPIEIAMTLIVGISSLAGIVGCAAGIQSADVLAGSGVFLLSAGFQVAMLYVSFLPGIAHR
ncbi:MAG TPA: hypothetical protein VGF61_24390 [Candidatus Acidoferrum sp.]|jgi:hypothetical protein